jgi:hypothetical protein
VEQKQGHMNDEIDPDAVPSGDAGLAYRGKRFSLPTFDGEGFEIVADASKNKALAPSADDSPIIADLNSVWDLKKFMNPRLPVSLGLLEGADREAFSRPGAPRTLDMPIKFPGSNFRVPRHLEQFRAAIERVAHFEAAINPECFDEYYCYMTVDQGPVKPETLQREAPCHVDGFQGARWSPKVRINHSYVVGDQIPTTYYPQPFDFSKLDEARHNFFWEMNRVVAASRSAHAWRPQNNEISMIDAYTVHRGTAAEEATFRTWIRLSFEVRKFDRLGNAHNPMFKYDWNMVERDIEGLGLVAFDQSGDPSLRVFPWQDETGAAHADPKKRTKPKLE